MSLLEKFNRKPTRFQGVSSPSALNVEAEEVDEPGLRPKLRAVARIVLNPIVVLAPFIVAFAAMSYFYFEAYQREADHDSAISAAQASLAAQPASPDALRVALDGWAAALEAADEMRVRPQFDSSLLAQIIAVAESAGARLVSAGLQSEAVATISESEYLSTPIRLRAAGTLDVLRDFIASLEDGQVEALEVQRTELSAGGSGYSAVIQASVFSQPDLPAGAAE